MEEILTVIVTDSTWEYFMVFFSKSGLNIYMLFYYKLLSLYFSFILQLEYSSPPFSAVSVTSSQTWSRNIQRNTPEITLPSVI